MKTLPQPFPHELLNPSFDVGEWKNLYDRANDRVVFLDYDGTLAPFTTERDRAFPYPGIRENLSRLRDSPRVHLVIISGRSIEALSRLLDLDPLPELWGSHGWEHLDPMQGYTAPRLSSDVRSLLDQAEDRAMLSVGDANVERKSASVAVHVRGLKEEESRTVLELLSAEWVMHEDHDLVRTLAFDGGLELRAIGRTKANAVLDVLARFPAATPAVYIGDDITDEDAFLALEGHALRVLARKDSRPTRADIRIEPPGGLLMLLDALA